MRVLHDATVRAVVQGSGACRPVSGIGNWRLGRNGALFFWVLFNFSLCIKAVVCVCVCVCVCVSVCVWVLPFLPGLPSWTCMATLASLCRVAPHYSRPLVQARGASLYCPSTSVICT